MQYDSDEIRNANLFFPSFPVPPNLPSGAAIFLYALNFSVPSVSNVHNKFWRVKAELGFEFLSSGSMGLLLERQDSLAAPSLACLASRRCSSATLLLPNRKILDVRLAAGDYRIWIYDIPSQRLDDAVPVCVPFSFAMSATHVYEQEDFLGCTHPLLPASFDEPGYMTSDGRLNVNHRFLLSAGTRGQTITFTLPSGGPTRLFRLKTGENTQVDLDVTLRNPAGAIITRSRLARPFEENIAAELHEPGVYTIELEYAGYLSTSFCDSFQLVVSMAPVSASTGYCANVAEDVPLVVPDPSDDLSSTRSFSFATNPRVPAAYLNRSALNWQLSNFRVDSSLGNARLRVRVGQDYLMGHLQLTLENGENAVVSTARHFNGYLEVNELIEPGIYTLRIRPGPVSREVLLAENRPVDFPSCVRFSFELNITADSEVDPLQLQCWDVPELPSTLEQPQYLDNPSRQTYLAGRFLFPAGSFVTRDIQFETLEGDNMIRAFVDPHTDRRLDLDLVLKENGQMVASSLQGGGVSDQIVYRLKPKTEYTLTVNMYRLGANSLCDSFGMEIAVEPVLTNILWDGVCPPGDGFSEPPLTLIPSSDSAWPFSIKDKKFSFVQELNVTRKFPLWLNLTSAAFLRVQVTYEFVWGALALTLVDSDGGVVQAGAGGINMNSLRPIRLEPGNYAILLEHSSIPFAEDADDTTSVNLRCTSFAITAAIDAANDSEEVGPVGSDHVCLRYPLPSSLSSPSGLSILGGQRLHFSRHIQAITVIPRSDQTRIEIVVPSIVRVFIPELKDIDVDIEMAPAGGVTTVPVFSSNNRGENARVRKVNPGNYTLKMTYYAQMGSNPLPPMEACLAFPFQLEIIPVTVVTASPASRGGAACPVSGPITLPADTSSVVITSTHRVLPSNATYVERIPLVLQRDSQVRIDLESQFATGYIWMSISSTSPASAGLAPLIPVMSSSGASFNRVLEAGPWEIKLYHPLGDDRLDQGPAEITCNTFDLRLSVAGGVASSCNLVPLPANVFSLQDLTVAGGGAFDLYGEKFTAPGLRKKLFVDFNVTVPSVLRVYLQSNSQTVMDVDLTLLNSNGTVFSWTRAGTTEDAFILLQPQTTAYTMQFYTFSVQHEFGVDCPSLMVYMSMEPLTKVLSERRCPIDSSVVLPPTAMTFGATDQPTTFPRTRYVLTQDALQPFASLRSEKDIVGGGKKRTTVAVAPDPPLSRTLNIWRYPIIMEVREPSSVRVSVASTFLTEHVGLGLVGSAGNVPFVATGAPSGGGNEDFQIGIEAILPAGVYTLNVAGDLRGRFFNVPPVNESDNAACASFSLEVFGQRVGVVSPPRLLSVFPASSTEIHNPRLALEIRLTFDHVIDTPDRSSFQQDVVSGPLIWLTDTSNSVKIVPSTVSLDASKTVVHVTFYPQSLAHNRSYALGVKVDGFLSGGAAFSTNLTLPVYRMQTCECGGHGTCNEQEVCVCSPGYSGPNCMACAEGYHAAQSSCIINVPCTATSCGAYGTCSNVAHGVPQCTCKDGYATVGDSPCSACASGFTGFPNCVLAVEDGSTTTCRLSLLPSSLNTPGYLAFDSSLHLSGRFYLDMLAKTHTTLFTLDRESVFRLYVEPHAVDVDIALRRDTGDGTLDPHNIATSVLFGGEEVIFVVLPPGRYGVVFTYIGAFAGTGSNNPCESAKMELVVRPTLLVKQSNNNLIDKCNAASSVDQLFSFSSPWNGTQVLDLVEGTPVTYRPSNLWSVPAAPGATATNRRVIGSRIFRVPRSASGSNLRAQLQVDLAYRFETGHLGLILEEGYRTVMGCETVKASCLMGTNGYDRNVINAFLRPATFYTLWLYEPVPQNSSLSKCSLFDFNMQIDWRQAKTSADLGCPGGRMPDHILDTGYGVHWAQRVALTPRIQNTTIFVGAGGMTLRASFNVNALDVKANILEGVDVALFRVNSNNTETRIAATYAAPDNPVGTLFASLSPGSYRLQVDMVQLLLRPGDETNRCRLVDVELAAEPASTNPAPFACPPLPAAPVFPVPLLGANGSSFILHSNDAAGALITYYTFASMDGALVLEVPFTIEQESVVMASVISPFLTSQMTIRIFATGRRAPVASSSVNYNEGKLQALRLSSGSYIMKIFLASPSTSVACHPYHFHMHLEPATAVDAARPIFGDDSSLAVATMRCDTISADGVDHLPRRLDTWKFLAFDGRLDLHSDRVLVPVQNRLTREVEITTVVRVSQPSLLRLGINAVGSLVAMNAELVFAENNTVAGTADWSRALVQVLAPNVQYLLNWTFVNWASDTVVPSDEAPWCRLTSVHMSIKPLAWSRIDEGLCVAGASKVPDGPLIPASLHIPSQKALFVAGDLSTYFLQQSSRATLRETYPFVLDGPANVLVEVRFDFAFADLRLSITNEDTFMTYVSSQNALGSSLLVSGLNSGRYRLILWEGSRSGQSGDEVLGCRPFTFRFAVEKDEGGVRSVRGLLPLPDTLNDVGYLDYDGSVHFAHDFDLPNVNFLAGQFAEFTNFSVLTPSILHVHARVAEETDLSVVPLLHVFDLTDDSASLGPVFGQPQLLMEYQLVPNHQYRIGWNARPSERVGLVPSEDVIVFVELSVKPVQSLQQAIQANPAYNPNSCQNQGAAAGLLPDIVIDPTGAFRFAKDDVVLAASSFAQAGTLSAKQFTLEEESVVFAVLENQFALSRLSFVLRSKNVSRSFYGTSDRNRRYLHEVIPAGQYELELFQNWTESRPPPTQASHCTVFSLHILVRPSWQGSSTHVADCSSFNVLPWNLSNPAQYGKSVNSATQALVIYGDRFLYPERMASEFSYSFHEFTFPRTSVHMLLFFEVDNPAPLSSSQYASDFTVIGFDKVGVMFFMVPYKDEASQRHRLVSFQAEESLGSIVQISYHNSMVRVGTCPYYTFASYVLSSDVLASRSLCSAGQNTVLQNRPPANLTLSADGTHFSHSYGAISTLGPQVVVMPMRVTVAQVSLLHLSLSTNEFLSSVSVNVSYVGHVAWRTGHTVLLPDYEDHLTNARVSSSEFLPAGTYDILVSVTSKAADARLTNSRGQTLSGAGLCIPWSLDAWVTPWSGRQTYIIGVSPGWLAALRPNAELQLNIYVGDVVKNLSQDVASLEDMLRAFVLAPTSNPNNLIWAARASANVRGRGVVLTWRAGDLQMGETYTLKLRSGELYNSDSEPLSLFSTHSYTVINSDFCGAHGRLGPDYHCMCNAGWGGVDCSVCGIGYMLKGADCVVADKPVCQPCSCGCDAANKPLGTCDDSSGQLKCTCLKAYKGDNCEKCADDSLAATYPLCAAKVQECTVPCVHGLCDHASGTCSCTNHWSGPMCDQCASNFWGADCDVCAPHFTGTNCEKCKDGWTGTDCSKCGLGWTGNNCDKQIVSFENWPYLLVALLFLVAVGVGLGVWLWRRRKRRQQASQMSYAMSALGPVTESEDDFFDDNLDQPAPVGLLSNEFHLSDEED